MAQYIDKSALVAEIEKLLRKDKYSTEYVNGKKYALKKILSLIDTLEVKEVDLEYLREELDRAVKIYKLTGDFGWGTLYNIAVHFFELGLKAQKGE